ncbi:MAG TPA: tRNA dihydrouridine(20/20a) synthase DusA [Steroidobacteraceae bacterium]|nr:tRNA dihydrouridine(20/20a) synthase DusA [Steroidobacteraceae bacterium]
MVTRRNSISVAPMMDWTDKHCRYFLRGFSANVLLYTEMITSAAILRGDRDRLLAFDAEEHPVALQLGGSDPQDLAKAARAGEEAGYDEINLNCGCPSDRVSSGAFGACLMREPERVADCVAAMKSAVSLPVTVKMRIGVIEGKQRETAAAVAQVSEEDFAHLKHFVTAIHSAGCEVAIVHARKAVLGGLSPKENREVPPLRYDIVRELKREFPDLPIVVNGGIRDAAGTLEALGWCDGVMLGREAYHRPMVLAELEHALHSNDSRVSTGNAATNANAHSQESAPTYVAPSREAILERMARYASRQLARGERLSTITRHMLGLYAGEPGARDYRRMLSEGSRVVGAGADLLLRAAPGLALAPKTVHI